MSSPLRIFRRAPLARSTRSCFVSRRSLLSIEFVCICVFSFVTLFFRVTNFLAICTRIFFYLFIFIINILRILLASIWTVICLSALTCEMIIFFTDAAKCLICIFILSNAFKYFMRIFWRLVNFLLFYITFHCVFQCFEVSRFYHSQMRQQSFYMYCQGDFLYISLDCCGFDVWFSICTYIAQFME